MAKAKASSIAEALGLPADLSVPAIIEQAQKFLDIPDDQSKKMLEKLDTILAKAEEM